MLKLKDGSLIVEQFTSYTFDTAPPKRVGDTATIRVSHGQLVRVTLRRGADGRLWLVAGYPARTYDGGTFAPKPKRVWAEKWARENTVAAKVSEVLQNKRAARLHEKAAIRARKELKEVDAPVQDEL